MTSSARTSFPVIDNDWRPTVPDHWEAKRARFCLRVNPPSQRLGELEAHDEVSFVPMDAIGEYGGLNHSEVRLIDEIGVGYTEFDDGDVVVAKITPCFENGKGALASGLTNGAAFGTTELHVLRAAPDLDRRLLFYLTMSTPFRGYGEGAMYGAGGQKRVPPGFCKDFILPLPSQEEQRLVADFLDRKTALIDALVTKRRTLIERLREQRLALISHCVCWGVPNQQEDGDHAWQEHSTAAWPLLPFTKYLSDKSDYRGRTPEKTDAGVLLVTAKNVRLGWIDYDASQEYVAEDAYDEIMRRGLPILGDILFTTEAPLGNVALVDRTDIALAQRIIRFRLQPDRFRTKFALYAMMADHFQAQLEGLSTGSTAEGLKASKLHILRIVAPPLEMQREIEAYLDRETARIDDMIAKVEQAIERLQEYRAALITAAVTGQIDVRGAAP